MTSVWVEGISIVVLGQKMTLENTQHCSVAHGEKGKQTLLPVHASSPHNYTAYNAASL